MWIAYPTKIDTYLLNTLVSRSGGSFKRHSDQSGVSPETCTGEAALDARNRVGYLVIIYGNNHSYYST